MRVTPIRPSPHIAGWYQGNAPPMSTHTTIAHCGPHINKDCQKLEPAEPPDTGPDKGLNVRYEPDKIQIIYANNGTREYHCWFSANRNKRKTGVKLLKRELCGAISRKTGSGLTEVSHESWRQALIEDSIIFYIL